MQELKELLNKIDNLKEIVETPLHNHDWRTRPGKELQKNTAKRELSMSLNNYRDEFNKRVTKVLVTGASSKNLNKLLDLLQKEELNVFQLPSIYNHMAESIKSKLSFGGEYNTPAFLALNETCRLLSEHFLIFPKVLLTPTKLSTITHNDEELVAIVKETVQHSFGDSLQRAFSYEQVHKAALEAKFDNKVAVVVATFNTEEEKTVLYNSLFPDSPTFVVDLENEEPTRAHALKLFQKITKTKEVKEKGE